MQVPLIIRAPWMPTSTGKHATSIVTLVDLYRTLASLTGAASAANAVAKDVDGDDFSVLLSAPDTDTKQAAFAQYPRCPGNRAWPHGANPAGKDWYLNNCEGVPAKNITFMGCRDSACPLGCDKPPTVPSFAASITLPGCHRVVVGGRADDDARARPPLPAVALILPPQTRCGPTRGGSPSGTPGTAAPALRSGTASTPPSFTTTGRRYAAFGPDFHHFACFELDMRGEQGPGRLLLFEL